MTALSTVFLGLCVLLLWHAAPSQSRGITCEELWRRFDYHSCVADNLTKRCQRIYRRLGIKDCLGQELTAGPTTPVEETTIQPIPVPITTAEETTQPTPGPTTPVEQATTPVEECLETKDLVARPLNGENSLDGVMSSDTSELRLLIDPSDWSQHVLFLRIVLKVTNAASYRIEDAYKNILVEDTSIEAPNASVTISATKEEDISLPIRVTFTRLDESQRVTAVMSDPLGCVKGSYV